MTTVFHEKAELKLHFPISAGGSRRLRSSNGSPMAHLLGSPTAQAIAATAHIQRRNGKY
jgi:hypothetical protein